MMIARMVLMVFLLITSLKFSYAQKYRMEYFAISPHIIVKKGSPISGSAFDYFNQYISPKLSQPITWGAKATPLARILIKLKSGDISFIPFILKKPERETYLHFSKKPYFSTKPAILVRDDFPLTNIHNLSDLKGVRVAFFQHGAIPEAMIEAGAIIKSVAGNDARQRMIVMLQYERIDAIFDYQVLSLKFLKKQFGYQTSQVLALPLPEIGSHFAASKNSVSKEYFAEFEEALKAAPPYKQFVNEFIEQYTPHISK